MTVSMKLNHGWLQKKKKSPSKKTSFSSLEPLANAQAINLEATSHYGLISAKQINLVAKFSFMQLHILFCNSGCFSLRQT